MKTHWLTVALMLAVFIRITSADSFDDAEAKRRGVSVSQVLAENALAKEKAHNAELEKQVAALKDQIAKLQSGAPAPSTLPPATAKSPATTANSKVVNTAKSMSLDLADNVTLKLVLIPAGKFTMGATPPQLRLRDELAHEVTISKPFFMGVTHVTVDQFAAFIDATGFKTEADKDGHTDDKIFANGTIGTRDGTDHTWRKLDFPQTGKHPVVNISWNDAQAFCDWLKKKSSKNVSLPTEAQWEYAARAGSKTEFLWGNDPDAGKGWANFPGREVAKLLPRNGIDYIFTCFDWDDGFVYTAPVASFKPNAFGLYDMAGNASQWCLDEWEDYKPGPVTDPLIKTNRGQQITRGGSWCSWVEESRAANRSWGFRDTHDATYGMRIVVNE